MGSLVVIFFQFNDYTRYRREDCGAKNKFWND